MIETLAFLPRVTEFRLIFTTPEFLPIYYITLVNNKYKKTASYSLLFGRHMFCKYLSTIFRFEFTYETGIP